jgi:hypothetical protein
MKRSHSSEKLGDLAVSELAVAGALAGAASGVLWLILENPLGVLRSPVGAMAEEVSFGLLACGVLGAVLGPLVGKTFLRRVPVFRGIGATIAGPVLAAWGGFQQFDSLLSRLASPFLGFLIAVIALWAWYETKRELGARATDDAAKFS